MFDPYVFEIYFVPSVIHKRLWHVALWNPLKKTIGYLKYEEEFGKKSKTRGVRDQLTTDGFSYDIVWMNGHGTRENFIERIFDIIGDYHLPRKDKDGFLILYTKEEARKYKPHKVNIAYNASFYTRELFLGVQDCIARIEKNLPEGCDVHVDRWARRTFEYYEPYSVKLFHQRVYQDIKKSWRNFESRPDIKFNLIDTIDMTLLTTLAYYAQMMQEYEDEMNNNGEDDD